MHTSRAPLRLAACARRQKWTLLVMALLPQMRISFDSAKNSTFMPILPPSVCVNPAPPALAQMVRSSSEAPRRWKNRAAMPSPCTRPMVPA
jgi:hypothetical protein